MTGGPERDKSLVAAEELEESLDVVRAESAASQCPVELAVVLIAGVVQ